MKTIAGDFSSVALLDDAAAKRQEQRVKSSLAAMRRRAWVIALFACVGVGGAATWLAFATPQYTSTALVQVDTRNKLSNFDNVLTSPRESDPDAVRTEVEVLRSDAVVERVVNALNLTNDPEFSAPATGRLAKLMDLLSAELENVFSSLSIWLGRRDPGSGSRGIDTSSDNGPTQVFNDTQKLGRASQLNPQTTVLTDNNGVILGSVVPGAAPQASQLQDNAEMARTIGQVRSRLSAQDIRRSYVIRIDFTASTAEKAARLANAFAEQYLAAQIDAKMALTSSANEWAKTQLETAGVELRRAEAAIEQFRAQHNAIIEVAPGNSVAVSQQSGHLLNNLNAQLATAARERIAAETRLVSARELIKRHRIDAIPDVLSSPLIQQLRIEEARTTARLAGSASIEGSKHPAVKALNSELGHLRESIDSSVKQIVSNLEAGAKDARAREEELASKIEALRKDVGDASQQQLQLSILERRAEGRRTFYAALEKRYSETSALMHGVYPDARIVSRARPQPLASWPNIPIVVASGLVLGAAIGAAIVALLALADKTFRTPMQLEQTSGLECLGVLPELGRALHRAKSGTPFNRSTRMFRESVRTIKVALDTAMGRIKSENRGRVVLVTSALPQEGKTVSSVALATALAASGSKTLLIDADLRKPTAGRHLAGISRSQNLESMLDDGEGYPAAAEIDTNLYAIKSGGVDEDAQRVFLTTRFGEFMETARAEFDSIVIDSPPAMVVADAAILARFADVVLHVVRWGRTRRSAVVDSVDRMHRANRKAIGVTMLNRASPAQYFKYNRDGGWSFRYAYYYRPAITTATLKRP
ncbi:MAG: polysaccharide biosynthesis tyrosine autokinase [Proteobacteria bacterium]|nr:polysaccharide biosynthesis tyrosine autokinase [Pseudomonadota bacterium]